MKTPNIKGLLAVQFLSRESAEVLLYRLRDSGFIGGDVIEASGKYSLEGLTWNPGLSELYKKQGRA